VHSLQQEGDVTMGIFMMLATIMGMDAPKPMSKRGMRILRAGGTRRQDHGTRGNASAPYSWDDWDDCCRPYLVKAAINVKKSQLNLDEAESMLYDAMLQLPEEEAQTAICNYIMDINDDGRGYVVNETSVIYV
jgi:hypothetical protein